MDEDDYVELRLERVNVTINGVSTEILLDSGASVNVIDKSSYKKIIEKSTSNVKLQQTDVRIFPYGTKSALDFAGYFTANIEASGKSVSGIFYVTKDSNGCLLRFKMAQELGLIKISKKINEVSHTPKRTTEALIAEYNDLFHDTGKLKNYQFKIHIDENVKPIAQHARRFPFYIRKQVETHLDKLESAGIIEQVEGLMTWGSPIVTAPKYNSDKVRVCVDMRAPNTAVERKRHLTPTVDEVITDLNSAKVFSKLDLSQTYHQKELYHSSRYFTTFAMQRGIRRYTRLMFGLSSASEKFQEVWHQVLAGIDGVRSIADDFVVFGKDEESHDEAHSKKGLKLSKKKCIFKTNELNFHGVTLSSEGLSADKRKIDALCNMEAPKNVS